MRARVARRVRAFSATCDSIVHSDLSRRLEVGRGGDEFDQLGRTVNEMLERIEQQAVLLRAAFGSIAHDLRTPLYRLRVRLEEALLHTDRPAAGRELVGPALGELDRVQRTLGTLLEIARAEGGGTVAGSEQGGPGATGARDVRAVPARHAGEGPGAGAGCRRQASP